MCHVRGSDGAGFALAAAGPLLPDRLPQPFHSHQLPPVAGAAEVDVDRLGPGRVWRLNGVDRYLDVTVGNTRQIGRRLQPAVAGGRWRADLIGSRGGVVEAVPGCLVALLRSRGEAGLDGRVLEGQ